MHNHALAEARHAGSAKSSGASPVLQACEVFGTDDDLIAHLAASFDAKAHVVGLNEHVLPVQTSG